MKLTLGTGGRFARFSFNNAKKLINFALDNGIKSFDTGFEYGSMKSQPLLANCLKNSLISNREGIVLSTKCAPKSPEYIKFSVQKSIDIFQCGYLDYFHLWGASIKDLENKEILFVLKSLINEGKIKKASVTTQDLRTIKRISKGDFDEIEALMLDYNLLKQNRLKFIRECKKNDIQIFAGTSLCQGLLLDSILKLFIRSRSPFYLARAFLKKETRNYLKPAKKARIYLKNQSKFLYKKIPLSFLINEKSIDFIPIGMLSENSIRKNIDILNNPVDMEIIEKVSKLIYKNCQVIDTI
tara:strand:- start:128 stop:1018 length:891 start_codon:yes stop_codon:yes gene_type:complete